MPAPHNPKIYHIVHVDKLASISGDGGLFSDAEMSSRPATGTVIGMNTIKQRRLSLPLPSYPDLAVGQCVPFYFCFRSVMLYMMHVKNAELSYKGGQQPIVHLVADLNAAVAWAAQANRRWAFTLSNAASSYFEDRTDLAQLNDVDWDAVNAKYWQSCRDAKQSEFLMEANFPWHLIEEIVVHNQQTGQIAMQAIANAGHRPTTLIKPFWYY